MTAEFRARLGKSLGMKDHQVGPLMQVEPSIFRVSQSQASKPPPPTAASAYSKGGGTYWGYSPLIGLCEKYWPLTG